MVVGDVRSEKIELGQVKMSQNDEKWIIKENELEMKLRESEKKVERLLKRSENLLSKTKNQTITADYEFGDSVEIGKLMANDVEVSERKLNDVSLEYLAVNALYTDEDSEIWGNKTFSNDLRIHSNLKVNGLVDQVNISDLVLLATNQVIAGRKAFQGNLFFNATKSQMKNLEIRGFVNDVNISKEELMTVKDDQNVSGVYTLKKSLQLEKDIRASLVNGINISKLYEEAVLSDVEQNITGYKRFQSNLEIKGDLVMTAGKTINAVAVSEMGKNVLSSVRSQEFADSFDFQGNVNFLDDLKVDGLINGINLAKDIVHLSRDEVISGDKTFTKDLIVHGNLEFRGLVNGFDMTGIYVIPISFQACRWDDARSAAGTR